MRTRIRFLQFRILWHCPQNGTINRQIVFDYNYLLSMEAEKPLNTLPRRIRGRHADNFRNVTFDANYFHVSTRSDLSQIYIFKVVFKPSIPADNTKLRMSILQKGRQDIRAFIDAPVFSGLNIYSLNPPKQQQRTIKVDDHELSIKQVKVHDIKNDPRCLMYFLNNSLRNLLRRLDYTEIGRTGKFFNVRRGQDIDNELRMYYGVKANFMKLEKGIFLRVDSAKKIVRNQSVCQFINDIYARNKHLDRDQKRNILKQQLIGQTIMTNYGKTRYLRVKDVIFETIDDVKLRNSETTLREFYKKKYGKQIKNSKQPLLEVESKNKDDDKQIIVPELCLMTGIPDSFDEMKRKKISQRTIKSAAQKKRQIQDFMRQVESARDFASLKEIGVSMDHRMEQVKGKIIPAPTLALGRNRNIDKGRQSSFQLFRDPIFKNDHQLKCGIIAPKNVDLRGVIDTFRNTSQNLQVNFKSITISINQPDRRRVSQAIKSAIDSAVKKNQINICLVVIPYNCKDIYPQIKKQCLQQSNVVSQCVVQNTLRKKNLQSIATKILLQMIAKCGNVLWVPRLSTNIRDAMIMAFDTAKVGNKNILSCCATVNETFSSVSSKTAIYQGQDNKFNQMKKLSLDLIKSYAQKNSRKPRDVVIFHNASSGDQMRMFNQFYLQGLREQLDKSYSTGEISITFIMVNTKTNERFFSDDNNGVKNVQAGSLVSNGIVSQNYDFYLVSQFSNRGSVVPNHYKVVYCDSKMQQGLLQQLIYSQCFNYVNWTGSIKVPGILQYAKKCAKFSTQALGGNRVCRELENNLYFV